MLISGDCSRTASAAAADPSITEEEELAIARRLGQFYTHPEVAVYFLGIFQARYGSTRYQMIEPSAGAGAFLDVMSAGSVGVDIAPGHPDVWKADLLKICISSSAPIAFLGNPRFGRNSNLAIAFVNRAAAQSDVVAFILPRTARKASSRTSSIRTSISSTTR